LLYLSTKHVFENFGGQLSGCINPNKRTAPRNNQLHFLQLD